MSQDGPAPIGEAAFTTKFTIGTSAIDEQPATVQRYFMDALTDQLNSGMRDSMLGRRPQPPFRFKKNQPADGK